MKIVVGGVVAFVLGMLSSYGATEGGEGTHVLFEPVENTKGLVIALVAIFIAIQSSEDLGCIATGFLVADGFISYGWGVAGCFAGIVIGDFTLYLLGKYGEATVLQWGWIRRRLTPARIERWKAGFHRSSLSVIILSRFIPGSRVPVYFLAGMLGVPVRRFLIYLGVTAGIWTPILVAVSMWLGRGFLEWFEANKMVAIFWLIAIGCVIWIFIHGLLPAIGRGWKKYREEGH